MLYKNYTDLVNKLVWIIPKKSKRDNMRNILNDIVNTAYKIEYLINNNNSINDKDYIIINQCDGFAGQLGKYIFGEFVKDNYNKNVKYDTSWYSISGLDIEKKEKTTINDIFESKGEAAFRDMETETVKEFADSLKKCVVSVGGGLPVRKENREILKNIGTVVYLKASEEELCKRLSRDNTRPLLKGGNLKEKIHTLMQQREDIYMDAADVVINTENVSFGHMYEEIISQKMR